MRNGSDWSGWRMWERRSSWSDRKSTEDTVMLWAEKDRSAGWHKAADFFARSAGYKNIRNCWLEKVNSSAKVNSTALLKVAYNLVIFKKKSGIYAIIQVIYGEIFCFSVWQTSCWRSVCTTKFHQPHLKNVKSLLPVWQQISSWVSGYSGSA